METLHRHDDEALSRIVEPAQGGIAEPINRPLKCYDRIGIIALDGIIDDQNVAAAAGQRAPNRCRETVSATASLEFTLGSLFGIETGAGKNSPVKWAVNKRTAVARELVGEILRIARTNYP